MIHILSVINIFFFHSLVYTLWKFPDLLLSFTTWPPVLEKLKGGAGVCIVGLSDLRFYLYAAFILRNESKFKLFSDQVVQVMKNLESHGI